MKNIVVAGGRQCGKTTLASALSKKHGLVHVFGDTYARGAGTRDRVSDEKFFASVTDALRDINAHGTGWVLDMCIDATPQSQEVIQALLTPGTACVLFVEGDSNGHFSTPEGAALMTICHEPGTPQRFPSVEEVSSACGFT